MRTRLISDRLKLLPGAPLLGLLAALVVLGCGRSRPGPPAVDALVEAVDSARVAVWHPSENANDTLHHSAFYDSVLYYVRRAVPIEGKKREYAAHILALGPLLPANLSDANRRKVSEDSLEHYAAHREEWRLSTDTLYEQYRRYVQSALDTIYSRDAKAYASALPNLLRRDIFEPDWRPAYDSVEASLVARTIGILHFIDSNEKDIQFDTTLQFSTPELAGRFDSLRAPLDSLSSAESDLLHRAESEGRARAYGSAYRRGDSDWRETSRRASRALSL